MFEKEAEEYAKQNNPAEYGVRATHFTVLNSFKDGADFGYNKAKEDIKYDLMMKLKDEGLVKPLKDSILRNERLSSQEQQELCAWIECAMDFGENLDECAKELEEAIKANAELKSQIEKMKCCQNCLHYRHFTKDATECAMSFVTSQDCKHKDFYKWESKEKIETLKKSNEWHYVKDGDLPKIKKKVLVLLKDVEEPILDYYRQDGLWNYALENEVIAWKEIVLPELKENEQ